MNTIDTAQMTNVISLGTYNRMKTIVKLLRREVAFTNKAPNLNTDKDFNFANFNNSSINGIKVAQLIAKNPAILPATNLIDVATIDSMFFCVRKNLYGYDTFTVDSIIVPVISVLHSIEKLISLGRHGIYTRVSKNNKLRNKISQLNNRMTLL